MKRMKKKVVAMVTLAMFVLSMVPMAAFADVAKSQATVVEGYEEITVDETGVATAEVAVELEKKVDAADHNQVAVWLTNDQGVYRYATPKGDGVTAGAGVLSGVALIDTDGSTVSYKVKFEIPDAGEYTLHAGIAFSADGSADAKVEDLTKLATVNATGTITVTAAESFVKEIKLNQSGTVGYVDGNNVVYQGVPNSTDSQKVVLDVKSAYTADEKKDASSENKVIKINNGVNSAKGLNVIDVKSGDPIDEVTVGKADQAVVALKAEKGTPSGTYYIYFSADKAEYKLAVKIGDSEVQSIEVVDTTATKVSNVVADANFENVAKVVFKDAAGNVVTPAPTTSIKVTSQPTDKTNRLKDTDVSLVAGQNSGEYKLKVSNLTKLNLGDYTVRVALTDNTGDYVDLSFTVVKPGKMTGIKIVMDNNVETVVSGQNVGGTVYAVDENGLETPAKATNIKLGYINSPAAVDGQYSGLQANGRFRVYANSDDKYVGSVITVYAFDEKTKTEAKAELTVVDGLSDYSLTFDSEEGKVAADNTVKVQVVDENGKVVKVAGTMYTYVESSSNQDAKVEVANQVTVKDGKADLTVFSNEQTTANINVKVMNNANDAVYAGTLKYTFGEDAIPAGTSVVMTLGSTEMVINNNIVDMKDAAPFAQNNRTFVPFRALGEALDAEVVYEEADKTVTYTLGSTKIVMTLDSKTYTVNGVEKTMDVAPFAKDGRTYVPVRFVGEALGFTVNALQNAAGEYVTVVFTK